MKVDTIKTRKINVGDNLFSIIDESISGMQNQSILVVTSKIISLCEKNVYKKGEVTKDELIKNEADLFFEGNKPYGKTLTIKNKIIVPDAGIDESNVENAFVVWPKDVQGTANKLNRYLKEKFCLTEVGVIITDSKTTPLRWGTIGIALGYSGFYPLKSYIGEPDLFGKELEATKADILDGLASSAVLVMGEGNEQTPMAIIEDLPFVKFNSNYPTAEEIAELEISLQDDIYAPILTAVNWEKR